MISTSVKSGVPVYPFHQYDTCSFLDINKEIRNVRLRIKIWDVLKKEIIKFYFNFCFTLVKLYLHIKFPLYSIIDLFRLAISIFDMVILMVSCTITGIAITSL